MKKILILMVLMFMVSVCGADTVRIWWGGPDSRVGYQIDSGWVLHHYGNNIDTLFDTIYIDATNIDTFVVITGTGEHKVAIEGYYDGYPEWYEIKDWPVTLTIGTDLSGAGPYATTIYATDTSGTDAYVSGIPITFRDLTGTTKGYVTTNSSGYALANLDSGSYDISAPLGYGYTWTRDTILVPGAALTDTLWGYNVNIGSPGAANLCRLYDYVHDAGGNAVEGAIVTATLGSGQNVRDSCSNVSITNFKVTAPTNSSGKWELDLIKTLCLESTYASTKAILYKITVAFPSGTEMVKQSYTVPDSTTHQMVW